ncbi:MAG: ATP-dependent DNA helicase [Gammaproteobacteria bacterium]|nr:ATP-dependent DNA helicase [Gammaproteobacteria bacterium]
MSAESALRQFHPASQNWFRTKFGAPTSAQMNAWPAIKAGRHTLISAPTGSGKTLAAFYGSIDALLQKGLRNQLEEGVHILYVSPLKALSNDIQRNLDQPLDGIAEQLHLLGLPPVDIRVGVRTGDTPASERQRMARHPPHILVTTPESLYLLLTSASGRAMLATVSTVIVDEIHALLGDKRGSHLALSLERLRLLCSKSSGQHLQRIGLSATQRPIDMVARYLIGGASSHEEAIECDIVDSGFCRKRDLRIEVPGSPLSAIMSNEVWEELYERLVTLINTHQTTLIFVNTRRLSERLALALSERLGDAGVCSHHGSMSKDHRYDAEQRLKAGDLKVLVATASMELGIDVGSVDLVVQFSSPKSIAVFLQRVGRSGHSVHATPKGILFPLTRDDLVEATALLQGIQEGELDQIVMPEKPMDILAQQIVAEVSSPGLPTKDGVEPAGWDLEQLFELFVNAYPYRNLNKDEFETLIKMLAEGYSTRRGRRGAYLHLDLINSKLHARRGANLVSLTNGGAIPDMFDYQVVLDPDDTVVGTLNEDFALEAAAGDVFTLGTHAWQMLRVDGLKVRVRDAEGLQPTIPFWFGEGPGRTRELSEQVSKLRNQIADLLISESVSAAERWLEQSVALPRSASSQLVEYLQNGMNALGVMPSRDTLVMERFFDEVGDMHVVIHSPFGSRLNRGWGLALRKKFCKSFNFELQAAANEDSIVISLGSVHSFPLDEVYRYLQTATVRDTLIQAMLDAPMFDVRWRWNATRSLAVQRNRAGKRVPPQFQRMDAEDLVAHVFPDQIACQENIIGHREVPDHPLVNQTIHDCLTEAMDIDELEQLIAAIEGKELTLVAKDLREPSPFAQEIINARPYAFLDDAPFEERRTNAIRNRRWADSAEAKDFSVLDEQAIQRVRREAWPSVGNAEELHDALLSAGYFLPQEFDSMAQPAWHQSLMETGRIMLLTQLAKPLWVATEQLPRYRAVFPEQLIRLSLPEVLYSETWNKADALREIIRGRLECLGPVAAERLAVESALPQSDVYQALLALEVEGFAFQGHFTPVSQAALAVTGKTPPTEWCERKLLQRIHRYTIDQHKKKIKPVSLAVFTEYLFEYQQLLPIRSDDHPLESGLDGQTRLHNTLKILDGSTAPAVSWESDIFPARIPGYEPEWLDAMCISGKVIWGRYLLPATQIRRKQSGLPAQSRRSAGPVKSTPVSLLARTNQDIWKALAETQTDDNQVQILSDLANCIEADLLTFGASFLDQIQSRTDLRKSQLEEGLAELVSIGRVCSDSFSGLRALLTPNQRRSRVSMKGSRKAMFGFEDAGRWSLLQTFPGANEQQNRRSEAALDGEQMERLSIIYLQRWGVVFRALIEKESLSPPWRALLAVYRRMELKGIIRGGRFISGVGGEQFAFAETIDSLRKFKRTRETPAPVPYYCLSATDPANLINLILPTRKLARLAGNRALYQGGVPIALMESGKFHFLRHMDEEEKLQAQQMLTKKVFPPRLNSYLGVRKATAF